MTKKQTLTATFKDGAVITRKTARTYSHVVRAYSKGYYPEDPQREKCWFETWCGRPDLMEKQVQIAKNWIKEPNVYVRIEVQEVK